MDIESSLARGEVCFYAISSSGMQTLFYHMAANSCGPFFLITSSTCDQEIKSSKETDL